MQDLIAQWRKMAADEFQYSVAATLHDCANELEREWHEQYHNSEFVKGCPHCAHEFIEAAKSA